MTKTLFIPTLGALLGAAVLSASLVQAEGVHSYVGDWEVYQEADPAYGCTISKEFDDGTYVQFGTDNYGAEAFVAVYNDDFEDIVDGESYPVLLDLDGVRTNVQVIGVKDSESTGFYFYESDLTFLLQVAERNTFTMYDESGDSFSFSLAGTYNGLAGMLACMEEQS